MAMRASSLALLISTLLLSACRLSPATETAPAPVGPGADDNLNAVAWVQASVEYRMVAEQTYRAAAAQLDVALADPAWDALVPEERDRPAEGLPPAVIVDVDETLLDNATYQARLVRDGAAFDEISWDGWVAERKALAVPGAVAFVAAARERGVAVFLLTNRAQHHEVATLENLAAVGFPPVAAGQYLGLGTFVEGCEQQGSEKSCRRRHIGRSHRVLLQVGDQLGDFVGILANTPAGRDQALAPQADWVGERWWVVPNPTYGSWEPALFNNAWDQPPVERRRQKLAALRY